VLKQSALIAVDSDYEDTGLLHDTPQREAGLKVIHALLNLKKSLPVEKFRELVPDRKIQADLLQQQVFAYHPSNNTITFQSRIAETFARERLKV
jgi:hypothetical protein